MKELGDCHYTVLLCVRNWALNSDLLQALLFSWHLEPLLANKIRQCSRTVIKIPTKNNHSVLFKYSCLYLVHIKISIFNVNNLYNSTIYKHSSSTYIIEAGINIAINDIRRGICENSF